MKNGNRSFLGALLTGNLVLYNALLAKWLSFGLCNTIMLFGITVTQKSTLTTAEARHEAIHRRQWFELFMLFIAFIVGTILMYGSLSAISGNWQTLSITYWPWFLLPLFAWYILYGITYLLSFTVFVMTATYPDSYEQKDNACYITSAMDIEAYDKQYKPKYLYRRIPFAWLSYLKASMTSKIKWQKRGFFIKTFV